MSTTFTIERANNGFIISVDEDTSVYSEICDNEVHAFAEFLRYLDDNYGPMTSRYSEERIYISIDKGDKCDD